MRFDHWISLDHDPILVDAQGHGSQSIRQNPVFFAILDACEDLPSARGHCPNVSLSAKQQLCLCAESSVFSQDVRKRCVF